jgi:hypothetical protein
MGPNLHNQERFGIVATGKFRLPRSMTKILCRLFLLTAMSGSLHAIEIANASIDQKMKDFVESKEIPGAVTLVADENHLLHLSAAGLADIGNSDGSAIRREFQNAAQP